MTKNGRIVICDDHMLFREGIKAVLAEEPSIEVVGEAENRLKAVEIALALSRKVTSSHEPAFLQYNFHRS